MNRPTVFLIPNTLGEQVPLDLSFPSENKRVIEKLKVFAVEHIKEARRLLVRLNLKHKIGESRFYEINKNSDPDEQKDLIGEIDKGNSIGVISDAGCPSIADPGSGIVAHAHRKQYNVHPLVGPSSILMALMASGFNGQSFTFHGYLDRNSEKRQQQLKQMEKQAIQLNHTQLFMETPYRNEAMIKTMLSCLNPATRCCIASAIQQSTAFIQTKTIADWKKSIPSIQKQPTIFLLSA